MKVLLVDDNEDITELLFKAKGFEIVETNDAMEGLRHIQQEKYDAILLDMKMPGISGFNIIQLLATDDILKDQNIFIFSASAFGENEIRGLLRRDGVNGVLKKPMKLDEILTAITN
jgi:DNA-binding response OmpR family regulator